MRRLVLALVFVALGPVSRADAGSLRLGLHGLHLAPQSHVEDYADASWGGGVDLTYPLSSSGGWVAIAGEIGIVNFRNQTFVYTDPDILLRTEQKNSQNLFRGGVGLRLGPHLGPVQPYAGIMGYVASHGITSKLVVPNDADPDNTIEQDLGSSNDGGVGWAASGGLHVPLTPVLGIYGSASWFQLYGIDEPLGEEEVTIDPEYFEILFGLSISLGGLGAGS
jgi:hypothetical protein